MATVTAPAAEGTELFQARTARFAPVRPGAVLTQATAKVVDMVAEARTHIAPAERDTILLLLATALVTPAMGVLRLSPVLGFLFAGMVLGPAGLAVISDVETTTKLAELGVVFFLFEMGLELEVRTQATRAGHARTQATRTRRPCARAGHARARMPRRREPAPMTARSVGRALLSPLSLLASSSGSSRSAATPSSSAHRSSS